VEDVTVKVIEIVAALLLLSGSVLVLLAIWAVDHMGATTPQSAQVPEESPLRRAA
jgi:hypothetical protein